MKRWSIVTISLVFLGALACAQQSQPSSQNQLLSSDLVLWSAMQEPQQPEGRPRQTPTPDPNPETQPPQTPTPSQPGQPAEQQPPQGPSGPSGSQNQSPVAQTFTGIISKEADSYTLKVSPTVSYKLDNQHDVQQYEGKRVRVTGILDSSINLIRVEKIEPLS